MDTVITKLITELREETGYDHHRDTTRLLNEAADALEAAQAEADQFRALAKANADSLGAALARLAELEAENKSLKLLAIDQWAQKTTASPSQPSQEDADHQAFIDTLTDPEDKMFQQVDAWARKSYAHHKASVRGQQLTATDSFDSHLVWAALRWAKDNAQPSQALELSDEEIEAVAKPFIRSVGGYWENEPAIPDDGHIEEFARAIIAAINSKAHP